MAVVTPRDAQGCPVDACVMDTLHSGYVKRSSHLLPRQGNKAPWKVSMDYRIDRAAPVAPVPSELAHA